MRKLLLLPVLLGFILSADGFAQSSVYNIKVGMLNPKATDTGFTISFGSSREFDDRVDLGISLDFLSKRRDDEETISWKDEDSGTTIDTVVTNFESSITMLPLMVNLTVRFPMESPFLPYGTAGLGYNLLINKYNNYESGDEETNLYRGFCYRLGVGTLYPIGSNSSLIVELFYFISNPSHSEDTSFGLPVRTELNMSGIGLHIGVRLGGMSKNG